MSNSSNGEDASGAAQAAMWAQSEARITYGVSSIARYDFSVAHAPCLSCIVYFGILRLDYVSLQSAITAVAA
jgi:hypothetical protein